MIKVLSIGTDRKLFEKNSQVFLRQRDYAEKLEELHIIVFSLLKNRLEPIHDDKLHIYPTNSSSRMGYIFDAIKIGKTIIQDNNFVITTQDPFETGFVGYKLKKKFNLPLQIQIHTDFLSPYFKNSILNRMRVKLAKFLISKANSLRVVSSVISDSIKQKYPNLKTRMDVLPIFVDIENIMKLGNPIHDGLKPYKFTILMASRLTKEKRISDALNAFKKITEVFPVDVGLYIVGSGHESKNLENQVIKLELNEKVKMVGWEEDGKVLSALYRVSDIFLLTSEYEGYGMTLIEAGASGCPIVTTEVGIAKTELFKNGENAFVCPVGDVDCLSKSLIDLLQNEEKRKSFSEKMRASIKDIALSREEYVSRYVALLEKLK